MNKYRENSVNSTSISNAILRNYNQKVTNQKHAAFINMQVDNMKL